MEGDGALPAGPLAAVAALWGSDEPSLGIGSKVALPKLAGEPRKDLQLSSAVAPDVCDVGGKMPLFKDFGFEDTDNFFAPRVHAVAEPVFLSQGARAVPSFQVEPVFQQPLLPGPPGVAASASSAPAPMLAPGRGPAARQPMQVRFDPSQAVRSPFMAETPEHAGFPPAHAPACRPIRPPAPQRVPAPVQQLPYGHSFGTAPSVSMGKGKGGAWRGPNPEHAAAAFAASTPGHDEGVAAATAAAATPQRESWQEVRDLGARKAHPVDCDDEDYGRMEVNVSDVDHIQMPDPDEVEAHMAAMLPPMQARDLGARRQHATPEDDMQEMLMLQHLSMFEGQRDPEDESVGALQPQPEMQTQTRIQEPVEPVEPSWVIGAPAVAQDLKKAAHYWKDPLTRADFAGAIDYRAMQMPQQEPEVAPRMHPQAAPGERVYYEERWDESVLVEPPGMRGPHSTANTDFGPPIGAAAMYYGQAAAQNGGPVMRPEIQATQGQHYFVPPRAASGLAAQLDNVISHLEGSGDASVAVDDLREIEAKYNAALNTGRM